MNVFGWVLLLALAVAAGATWVAVAGHRQEPQTLSRPAFRVLLLALAWLLRADTVDYGRFLLVGLALGLVADWLAHGRLQGTRLAERAALATMLAGRLAYVVAISLMPTSAGPVWLVVALTALVVAFVGRLWLVPAARAGWRAGIPGLAYVLVLAAVPAAAWSSSRALLGLGATLLFAGDVVLAYERFERPLSRGALVVQGLHDVGEVLIVFGMLRP